MTSIVELFPKCRKLAYDARQQIFPLQQGSLSLSDLLFTLEELERQLTIMDTLVYKETPGQRQVWQRKIAELRLESENIARQGQSAANARRPNNQQQHHHHHASERDELLRRRRRQRQDDNESDVNQLSQESQSINQSSTMVYSLIDQGQASLDSLVEQRRKLHGVNRIVFDIGSRLGLAQSTMRIIERRDITDAYFVLGGMIVTCLVIYFVWF